MAHHFILIGGSCHKYRFCRDKSFIATNTTKHVFCRDKTFVVTKDLFCRDKHVFVTTKIKLVAAPVNDISDVHKCKIDIFVGKLTCSMNDGSTIPHAMRTCIKTLYLTYSMSLLLYISINYYNHAPFYRVTLVEAIYAVCMCV